MEELLYVLAKTVSIYLSLVSITMLVRVVLQLFTDPEGSIIFAICYYISEPFIVPFRFVLAKLNIGQSSPLDMGFLSASIGLVLLSAILPVI